jgi:hypothetical protein
MYVLGGSNDHIGTPVPTNELSIYNVETNKWDNADLDPTNKELLRPAPRVGHSCVAVENGKMIGEQIYTSNKENHAALIVFGGWCELQTKNDLWKFNCRTRTWEDLTERQKSPPKPRSNHSCVLIDHNMVVFGGLGEEANDDMNDVHILDLRTLTWRQVDSLDSARQNGNDAMTDNQNASASDDDKAHPSPSRSHAACVHRKRMVIFGGGTEKQCYNELWIFDLEVLRWQKVLVNEPKPLREAKKANQQGYYGFKELKDLKPSEIFIEPEPRLFCEAQVLDKDKLVVFGGRNSKQRINETWKFDFESNEWELLQFGHKPESITLTLDDEEKDNDQDLMEDNEQYEPSARSGCRLCTVWGGGKKRLIMFGGNDGKKKRNEVWELILEVCLLKTNLKKIMRAYFFSDVLIRTL